ncbi:divalent-cation tolerance protein CutA [Ornithinimicrobium sp. F0845]|uniref:divalent-cation tolerance protein CutA n=1 Tax=Ornithinimicrobium sp. F0845 TaxID=2926412 RepID=UPI001FF45525|nr:divalent-cation tolerance protein CutA [Ornithinimicrobium sp. F0845]MCK0111997.1 divalent-cation tolerance protein CutA [Ornithinimicrobium sp. F0845]
MSELTPVQKAAGDHALIEVHISMPEAEAARAMATELVRTQVAACVQILGPMASIYTWQGEPQQSTEWLLLVKSTAERFEELVEVVVDNHSYDTPEIVAVPVTHALGTYGAWVRDSVAADV